MPKLFKDENFYSDKLTINKEYANSYDNWRQKEELHKLKARYGEDIEVLSKSVSESSDSSDDDEGKEIPEEFEKSFYKTLACLKNRDPRIYNENVKFFKEPEKKNIENGTILKEKKEEKLFLRDYERKIIVERGGRFSDSENEDQEKQNKSSNPTYIQEQKEIKDSFKNALQEEDYEEEGLLKPKTKTKEEIQKEEQDYKEWLKGQKKNINGEEEKDLKPLRDFWTNPNLDENEKFLRDYILNKKFLEKEVSNIDLEYDKVVHDSDENLSEDENNINKQEEFEHKYNFRFEEPDEEFIKRYPRTLENSLRKKDTRRAQKRAEVKARKEQEKLKKKEEIKQLKALKRKEIEEKIDKLKEITGNDDLQLNIIDLEGDFDPDEYDKKMSQIFNEQYYAGEEDEVKPEFPDIDEELCIDSNWDNYDPTAEKIVPENDLYEEGAHCEDPEFNMDADFDVQQNLQTEIVESCKKKKKRKRSKFTEMISKDKPKFDPSKHSSYKEYYDQYYALDYEDMIGDLPCRFKYREVVPNDYGLTIEEILMADDKELNKWVSLKKTLQYKPEYKELNDVKMYKQKAANEALKKKVLKSLYSTLEEENETLPITSQVEQQNTKKRRRRKKKNQHIEEEILDQSLNQEINKFKGSSNNEVKIKNSPKPKVKVDKCSENKDEIKLSFDKNNLSNTETENINKTKRKLEESLEESNMSNIVEKKRKKKKVQNDVQNDKLLLEKAKSISNEEITSLNNKKNANAKKKIKNYKEKNVNKNDTNDETTLNKKQQRKMYYKKLKAKKEKIKEVDPIASLSTERLKAYGLNPKKFKSKLKYVKKN